MRVTAISGTFYKGMGETADPRKAQLLPAGSFLALPSGTAHYVFMEEETVIQISTNGPWGLTYINPTDPRQKSQWKSGSIATSGQAASARRA